MTLEKNELEQAIKRAGQFMDEGTGMIRDLEGMSTKTVLRGLEILKYHIKQIQAKLDGLQAYIKSR